ncbi:DUF6281 family protein [Streptomyces sp. NBC_00414]|uniref:DUF6281 family protein n=1 Tax=Streptomyces sp. NBC_00414 TaxID=2975739 RepID=UPI002E1E5EC1
MRAALPTGRAAAVWTLLSAVLVGLSVACTSSSDSGGESASSCAYLAEYRNRTYSGAEADGFTLGDKLGTATLPPCDDTPNDDSDGEAAASTTAHAIEGVDPGIAIALEQAPDDVIFVNLDSPTKLPEIKKMIRSQAARG